MRIRPMTRVTSALPMSAALLLAAILSPATPAADTIIGDAAKGAPPVTRNGYTASLTVRPVGHLDPPAAASDDLKLLKAQYGTNWTFKTGTAPDGTFNVLQYQPFALNTLGGADFSVLFDDKVDTPRTDYSWIQIGHPHNWGTKDSKDFIDSSFSNFPFYANYTPISLSTIKTPTSFFGPAIWLDSKNYPQQKIQNPAGGGKVPAGDLVFVDEPFLSYSLVPKNDYSSLNFDLYLVSFTWNGKDGNAAGGTVTLLDGMNWGVKLNAVPEPSALVLAGVGFVAVVVVARRRQRSPEGRRA